MSFIALLGYHPEQSFYYACVAGAWLAGVLRCRSGDVRCVGEEFWAHMLWVRVWI